MKRFFGILTVASALAVSPTASAGDFIDFHYQRASLFDSLPVDSTNIVFLGNSITNNCEWHELLGMPNVLNRGIGSDTTDGIKDRLDAILPGHPAKIFLMCGINDVPHNPSADSIASSVAEIIDRIRTESPSTKLYVQSVLPINNSFGRYKGIIGKEKVVPEINERLAEMADEKGFTWVNLYPHFADENGNLRADLTNDGLHLMGAGYLLWKDIIMPYVKE